MAMTIKPTIPGINQGGRGVVCWVSAATSG
jgi:hypothetical protein